MTNSKPIINATRALVGISLLCIGASSLAANGVPFRDLQRQIDAANATLENLSSGIEDRLTQFELDIAMLQAEMGNLQSQVDSNEADLADLRNATIQNASNISALEIETSALELELGEARAELLTKQNALTTQCRLGFYLVGVYADGTIVCRYPGDTFYLQVEGPLVDLSFWERTAYAYVQCPENYRVTGGGFSAVGSDSHLADGMVFERSEPNGWGGWMVKARHSLLGAEVHIQAHAVCSSY